MSFYQIRKTNIYLTSGWTLVLFVNLKCMRTALVVPLAVICRVSLCVCSKASVRRAMGYCLRRLYIYWFLRFGDERSSLEEKQNDKYNYRDSRPTEEGNGKENMGCWWWLHSSLKLQNVDVRRYRCEICLPKELFMNN